MEGQSPLFRCTTHLFDGVVGVVEGAWEEANFELVASRFVGPRWDESPFCFFFSLLAHVAITLIPNMRRNILPVDQVSFPDSVWNW